MDVIYDSLIYYQGLQPPRLGCEYLALEYRLLDLVAQEDEIVMLDNPLRRLKPDASAPPEEVLGLRIKTRI